MEKLNKSQLAWMLGIKPSDARDKMIHAYCKANNEQVSHNYINDYADGYPDDMDVDFLSEYLGIPNLRVAVDDICNNYLKRKATRSYILNYPLIKIQKALDDARKTESEPRYTTVSIPRVLDSMIDAETHNEIVTEWQKRYSHHGFLLIRSELIEIEKVA